MCQIGSSCNGVLPELWLKPWCLNVDQFVYVYRCCMGSVHLLYGSHFAGRTMRLWGRRLAGKIWTLNILSSHWLLHWWTETGDTCLYTFTPISYITQHNVYSFTVIKLYTCTSIECANIVLQKEYPAKENPPPFNNTFTVLCKIAINVDFFHIQ